MKGLNLTDALMLPAGVTKADFYTWSLTDAIVTFNGVPIKAALVILYETKDAAYNQTAASFRAEFSWRYEAPSGNAGTQLSYELAVCKKMMNLLVDMTSSVEWFNDNTPDEFVY